MLADLSLTYAAGQSLQLTGWLVGWLAGWLAGL